MVYSLLFLCFGSNSIAAAFTIGIIFEGLSLPAFMIVSTSQGAAKKDAEPGYVTASDLSMPSILLTSFLLEHSWSILIIGVIRLQGFTKLDLLMRSAVAFAPVPKRHISLVVG